MTLFRKNIDAMHGYTPGEQPKNRDLTKLNTNENPYPPAPEVADLLKKFNLDDLRRYPDPMADKLRERFGSLFGKNKDWVIAGNGSDDILTIAIRSFANAGDKVATLDPSYSLYPILSDIQDSQLLRISLTDEFDLPDNIQEQLDGCRLFFLTCPNAPTGNSFAKEKIKKICAGFSGVVLIDEAYVDFADADCADLVDTFNNVIISRTLSKSYSLAGIRLGFALASPELIDGMMKVKDSYNVNALTQQIGLAALGNQAYFEAMREKVIQTRERTFQKLQALGFQSIPSQTNFLFTKPPMAADSYFQALKDADILIRYFPGNRTGGYVRITIGTDAQMDHFLATTKAILKENE